MIPFAITALTIIYISYIALIPFFDTGVSQFADILNTIYMPYGVLLFFLPLLFVYFFKKLNKYKKNVITAYIIFLVSIILMFAVFYFIKIQSP